MMIVMPEYRSRNPLVRKLFWDRLYVARSLSSGSSNGKVLDVGCGEGQLLRELRLDGFRDVVGIDTVRCCREAVIMDVRNTSFPLGEFDTIYALDTLEHIPDVLDAIVEIRRILSERGELIVSMPTETIITKLLRFAIKGRGRPCAGVHYWNAVELDVLLRACGFKRTNCVGLPGWMPFKIIVIARYVKS